MIMIIISKKNVRSTIPMIGFMVAGVGITTIAISAFGDTSRSGWNAIVPFGSTEMVIVQVVAVAPLVWLLAKQIARGPQPRNRLMWVIIATCLLGATIYLGPHISDLCRTFSGLQRFLFRPLICLILILPWAIAFVPLLPYRDKSGGGRVWALIVVMAVFAWGAPAVYLTDRAAELALNAEQFIKHQQYLRAWKICKTLDEQGASETVINRPVFAEEEMLANQLTATMNDVSQPLPASTTIDERIARARKLAQLDQFDGAREVLGNLTSEEPAGALLLAAIEQQEEHWEASEHSCRRAIELLQMNDPEKVLERNKLAMQVQAYDGLIIAECHRFEYQAAEALLLEAVAAVPKGAAQFYYQLAQQERSADRTAQAATHFHKAAALDANLATAAEQEIQGMRAGTSGCFLAPTGSTPTRQTIARR